MKQLDAVVAATPHIAESFRGRCRKVVVVNNYPKLDDIVSDSDEEATQAFWNYLTHVKNGTTEKPDA